MHARQRVQVWASPKKNKSVECFVSSRLSGQKHCTHMTAFFIPGESNVFKGILHRKRAQEACAWISLDSACLFPLGSVYPSSIIAIDVFFKIFLVWTIFKVFIEFVTTLLLFYILVFWPQDTWDLSFPIKDRTHTLCIGRRSLNHWTAREVPIIDLNQEFNYMLSPMSACSKFLNIGIVLGIPKGYLKRPRPT